MNWSTLAAIADLCAALGVIVSLIYLATQVRENSQEIVESRTLDIYQMMIDSRIDITNGVLGEIMTKVYAGGALTAEETTRYEAYLSRILNIWEVYFFNLQSDKVDHRLDSVMRQRLVGIFSRDHMKEFWKNSSPYFSPQFTHYVEGILSESTHQC
jgi:hypothetical protein